MKTKNSNVYIKHVLATIVTTAMLLGTLTSIRLPAHAAALTVSHSGADVAYSKNGLTGQGVTVAVIDGAAFEAADPANNDNSIDDLRVIWGTSAISGRSANLLNASRVIWGQRIWSNRIIWGSNTSVADFSPIAIAGE